MIAEVGFSLKTNYRNEICFQITKYKSKTEWCDKELTLAFNQTVQNYISLYKNK